MSPQEAEDRLIELQARFTHDPHGWTLANFDWGHGELEEYADGPKEWQADILTQMRDRLQAGEEPGRVVADCLVQIAVASGHGIGKSALVAWIILWAMATMPNTRGVVTANTENQLRTKTWAELAKWHRLCLVGHWFTFTATALYSSDKGHEKTWRVDMIPWSENNTEAFAGLHNKGSRILLVFDEASAIHDLVWEVAEGALTDEKTEIIWCAFGNPTRNSGRFRECFGRLRHRWITRQIDSRTVPGTNMKQVEAWAADYGEDSDFFRVRVKGEFPKAGSTQLIASDVVDKAMETEVQEPVYMFQPLLIGVDVARYGDDQTVITVRQGRKIHAQHKFRNLDVWQVTARVNEVWGRYSNVAACFVDGVGLGAGVVDGLRSIGRHVIDVNAGNPATNSDRFFNKGAEMWWRMKQWLESGADIPNDPELRNDLVGREYGFKGKLDLIALESKDDMKKRGLASPDCADSIAMTFAEIVVASELAGSYEPELE